MRKFKECTGLETVSWSTAIFIATDSYLIGEQSILTLILFWGLTIFGFGTKAVLMRVLLVTVHWIFLQQIRGGPPLELPSTVLFLAVLDWGVRKLFQ